MRLTRRQAPPPPPCSCAERITEIEATVAAAVAAVGALRPRVPHHSIEQGLVGWGVSPGDAAVLARALRQRAAP
jgi:hypothetical protein